MLQHEREAWDQGYKRLAGVDEAGRGPWAGPVVAAAVSVDQPVLEQEANGLFAGLNDSKQLSAKKRELFFLFLTGHPAVRFGLGVLSPGDIDRLNILRATHRAMALALEALVPAPDYALVDGRAVPGLCCASRSIVKGDSKSLLIAAASVLAKVTRDRLMQALEAEHPGYGFGRHKGYGTAEHLKALRERGVLPCHRRSFRPVRELLEGPGLFRGEDG